MSIINKRPELVKREYELEDIVVSTVEKYATFIESTPDHVVNSALKILLFKDKQFMNWRKQQQTAGKKDGNAVARAAAKLCRKSLTRRTSSPACWRRLRV